MNNKDKYKSAIDQIHVREDLKQKTLNKVMKKKSKLIYFKYISSVAAIALLAVIGIVSYNNMNNNLNLEKSDNNLSIAKTQVSDLKRFDNMDELRKVLEEKKSYNMRENSLMMNEVEDVMVDASISSFTQNDSFDSKDTNIMKSTNSNIKNSDYSKTNTQVENVDEADIIKTDGNYIYCLSQNNVYIIKADNLKEVSKIEFDDDFRVYEIYLKDDKLIFLGNNYERNNKSDKEYKNDSLDYYYSYYDYSNYTQVRVYDITNRENPKEYRTVSLEGNYIDSRMIGNYIYFISSYSSYYRKNISEYDDYELLPKYKDSKLLTPEQNVDCTDIAYFENTNDYSYTMVAGFNVTKKDDVSIETFLGAGYSEVYASENNLYMVMSEYDRYYLREDSKIYKFALNNGDVTLKCKGSVPGYVDNQFSIDEYKGNLRIATTVDVFNPFKRYSGDTTTQLTILDDNLNIIGKIENLAYGEEIYSVRFMGNIGYVVTFEEVDPFFVIDLSNPEAPEVKGELKIPGYSSYLHMYDDTHVIGIGYNTKDNGYGGVKNDNMKMSMFDVSDLTNPVEMFSINIGEGYTFSEIINNHKALFFNKNKSLIGFPVNDYESNKNGFMFYEIDLENGFKSYDNLMSEYNNYLNDVRRAIYINDFVYILTNDKIISYDMNTFNKINELIID